MRARGTILAVLFVLSACAAPGARAPLVEGPVAAAAEREQSLDAARRGRELYVTVCTECHGAVNPAKLSDAEWSKVLPRMAKKADVSAEEESDIRAYIRAARAGVLTKE